MAAQYKQIEICVGCDEIIGTKFSEKPIQRATGGYCKTCVRKHFIKKGNNNPHRTVVIKYGSAVR